MSEPLILVTNDDGFDALGLAALVRAVEPLGDVVVAAPDREQSGAGHALTLERPLRVNQAADRRYRVDGTPTDCVHLAVTLLTGGRLPDLVVSGINRGLNVGDDVTYSGTVAGAMEGTLLRVPSIAFSMQTGNLHAMDYEPAVPYVRKLATEVMRRGLAPGVLLNVNVPSGCPRGVRVTRQGTRDYRATALERFDPAGRPYYWIDSVDMRPTGEPDGDHEAIEQGYVSICPLDCNLTNESYLAELARWDLEWE